MNHNPIVSLAFLLGLFGGTLMASEQQELQTPQIRISSATADRLLIKGDVPSYPKVPRDIPHSTVLLSIRVSPEGKVKSATVVQCLPVLCQPALDAVKQWEYRPFMFNGKAVEYSTTVSMVFPAANNPPQSAVKKQCDEGNIKCGEALEHRNTLLIGTWVAVNRSKGGIGSMWEFKPDGTLTMAPGAVVDAPYTLVGDKLTLPPDRTGPDAKPQVSSVRVDGDNLYQTIGEANEERHFVRVKSRRAEDPPIVGQWKLSPPTPDGGHPQNALQAAAANGTYTYTRDGLLKLRIPFRLVSGEYDVLAGTFTLNREAGAVFKGKLRLQDGKLYLTQPDGHSEDVYTRDDLQ